MLRFAATVLIVGGFILVGVGEAEEMKKRCDVISSLISSLDIMESEICDRLTPMEELMTKLGSSQRGEISSFFGHAADMLRESDGTEFSVLWRESVCASFFMPEEKEILIPLGESLGKYDAPQQKTAIIAAKKSMERLLLKRESERRSEAKTKIVSGAALGAFIAIIML